ncbi:MAG: hypothetical protein ABFE08_16315 [Armatimonadia bacterium]
MIGNARISNIALVEVIEAPSEQVHIGDHMTGAVSILHLRAGLPHREEGPAIIDRDGSTYWCWRGVPHREGHPAIEWSDGSTWWYRYGVCHRDDGPAVQYARGGREWYHDGELHRDDGPAVETLWGYYAWYQGGEPHRDDGPAIEYPDGGRKWVLAGRLQSVLEPDGSRCWCPDGIIGREDGPAVELADGTRMWCRDGVLHRDDGPAIEMADGTRIWLSHGRRHRVDGPAVERVGGDAERWIDGRPAPGPDARGIPTADGGIRTHCPHLEHGASPHLADGGEAAELAHPMCPACRRAAVSLVYETDLWQGHGRPQGYHRLDEVCDVLIARGLEDEAARATLAMMTWRCSDDWADPDADVWVSPVRLRRADNLEEPAGLHDLGVIPVDIEGLYPDQTIEDDVVVYVVRIPARIPRSGRADGPRCSDPAVGPVDGPDGSQCWHRDGRLHRDDGPAVQRPDGTLEWYLEGCRHRVGGPAIERPDGTREWYRRGRRHREDGPAIEHGDGYNRWFLDGMLIRVESADGTDRWYSDGRAHREDGAATILPDGTRMWCRQGRLHRDDGPAVEAPDGTRMWWSRGRRHRADGPAVEWADGSVEWWIEGELLDPAPDAANTRPARVPGCCRTHGVAPGGGDERDTAGVCDVCRRAVQHLEEELRHCDAHSWPNAYHPVSVVCTVLEYARLDHIADELRAMATRDHQERVRHFGQRPGDQDPEQAAILRYSHDSSGPARLSALGRIPVTISLIGPLDSVCRDDICHGSVGPDLQVPIASMVGRTFCDWGRCYERRIHDVDAYLGDPNDYWNDPVDCFEGNALDEGGGYWDGDRSCYDAIALDPPEYACEFGCDDALVAG